MSTNNLNNIMNRRISNSTTMGNQGLKFFNDMKSLKDCYDIDSLRKQINSERMSNLPNQSLPFTSQYNQSGKISIESAISDVMGTISTDIFDCDDDVDYNPLPFTNDSKNGGDFSMPKPVVSTSMFSGDALLQQDIFEEPQESAGLSNLTIEPVPFEHSLPVSMIQNNNVQVVDKNIMQDSIFSDNELKRALSGFQEERPVKKQKMKPTSEDPVSDESGSNFFRAYQAEQWTQRFEELVEFCKKNGHCQVPHTYTENAALARWVKRQRYQYKLKQEGRPSTMTDERINVLEKIGFVWDSHVAAWEERKNELLAYHKIYGHCNVPSNFPGNRQLAVWVKRQRRQYKFFWEGKPSNMNKERIATLEAIGFEWELRCRESK